MTRLLILTNLIQTVKTSSIACDLTQSADEYCASFCEGRCSFFNVTAGENGEPQNLTLFRITPTNVTDLVNKNTADAAGDIDFIISKKNLTQICLHDPTSMGCSTDRENEDMYAQFIVEIDGKFGPYSMCNPANGYDTTKWFCGIDCFEPTDEGCGHKYPQVNGTGWSGTVECFCDRTAFAVGREMAPRFSSSDMIEYPKQCAGGFLSMKKSCIAGDRIYKNLSAWSFESLSSIACQTCYVDKECTGWISYDNITAHLLAGNISNITKQKCVGAVRDKHSWSGGQWFGIANLGGCTKDSGCQNVWYVLEEEEVMFA